MGTRVISSAISHRRLGLARNWLEARAPAEEVLIVGANLDAANEMAREVAKAKGASFGWHRLTMPQLAAAIAGPWLSARDIVPISSIGVQAITARVIHQLSTDSTLGRYSSIAQGPGFARSIARVVLELRSAKCRPEALGMVAADLASLMKAYDARELTS